ncbi:MAG: hypothetical protein J0I50_01220 [Microbacterium sp.]|nr:hypothetical protein [Microbacterium sp.]
MAVYGADVDELRGAATDFERAADRLDHVSTALGGELARAPWEGADAERFRSNWSTDHSRRIADASTRLRDAARALRANADDQERTSTVDGGPGGSGLPGSPTVPGVPGVPGGGEPGGDPAGEGEGDGFDWRDTNKPQEIWRWGPSKQFENDWDVAGGTVHREGDYGVGAKATLSHDYDFSGNGSWSSSESHGSEQTWGTSQSDLPRFHEGINAEATAGAYAEDGVQYQNGMIGADAGYDAFVGGRAEAGGGIFAGPDGFGAGGNAGAFVGGEVNGHVGADLGGVGGQLEAGVRYGVGADASAHATMDWQRGIHLDASVGVSLGLGFKIHPSIDINPSEIAHNILHPSWPF